MARRSVCREVPKRSYLRYWLSAHGRKGHGVHSPYLYLMCRAVFARCGQGADWVSRALPCEVRRMVGVALRLREWSGAGRLVVPRGWMSAEAHGAGVVESGVSELIGRGDLGRGERLVGIMREEEWVRLSEGSWRELSHYLGEESWLLLQGVRADEASWQRWRWLSECAVFTVCIDRWHYGMVVYRSGMSKYSFGVR